MGDSVNKGTELEKFAEEAAAQDDIFSEAFDVADKSDGKTDEKVEEKVDGKSDDGPATALANSDKAEPIDDKAEVPNDKTDNSEADKSKVTAADPAKSSEQTYEQRWKSLEGILKSQQKKHEEETVSLKSQVEALTQKLTDLSENSGKKKGAADNSDNSDDDLSAEQKAALENYDKEFDAVAKMEGIKREVSLKKLEKKILSDMETKLKEIQEQFSSKVGPIEASIQKNDEESHFDFLKSKHPDYEKYRDDGSILEWIEAKPKYIRDALKTVYNKGTAEDVVDLINDFKADNNLLENKNNDQPANVNDPALEARKKEKDVKKQNLTAVMTKRGAVNLTQTSKEDFDGAFDEAVNK